MTAPIALGMAFCLGLLMLLPGWLTLSIGVPVLMVLSLTGPLHALVSIGDADIYLHDVVLLVVGMRLLTAMLARREPVIAYPPYSAIAALISTLLAATLVAYYRFGEEVFAGELLALLRLISHVSVFFFLVLSIRTAHQLSAFNDLLDISGYVIALSVYLSIVLYPFGITLGEVQASESGVRYFGFLGDQVALLLLFFAFKQLIAGRLLAALFLSGAILATGTWGVLLSLFIGLGYLFWNALSHRFLYLRKRVLPYVVLVLSFIVAAFAFDLGAARVRLTSGNVLTFGSLQRFLAARLAIQVFLDNPVSGVGYTGFRYLALHYGAADIFSSRLGTFAPNYAATAGNQFLQLATDAGIPGLLTFFWMLIVSLGALRWASIRGPEAGRVLFAAGYVWLFSVMLGNQTTVWLLPGSLVGHLFWTLVGSALAARKLIKASMKVVQLGMPRLANRHN